MEQLEQPLERTESGRAGILIALVEARLDRLQVPIAEVVEGEAVQGLRHMGEVERAEIGLNRRADSVEARQDPALLDGSGAQPDLVPVALAGLEQQPARVPELVRELAALLDGAVGEADVLGRGDPQQAITHGVGPVLVDQLERIEARPETLRHAPPVGRQHGRVDDHLRERDLAHQLESGEDHPVLPKPDDLARGGVQRSRIPGAKLGRLSGPTEDGEGPERRREPRIENVLAADKLGRAARRTGLRLGLLDHLVALGTFPDGKLVAPPDLPRDVPVRGALERFDRESVLRVRVVTHAPRPEPLERRLLQLAHRAPPLQRDPGLDPTLAALAESDRVTVGLPLFELAVFADPREDALLRLLLREPGELAGLLAHAAVGPDDGRLSKLVRTADFEIQGIVGGRHFERACTELHVDAFVGDHWNHAFDEWHYDLASDGLAPPLVVRMYGNGDVAEDRRRPGCRDRDAIFGAAAVVGERITHVGEGVVYFLVHELEVGECRLVERAPVDDSVRSVNPALAVQVDKEPHDRADVRIVHREPLAPVIHRRAHSPELAHDRPAVGVEPLPDQVDESLAAQLLPRLALGGEMFLDSVLRRDAGVVVAGQEGDLEPAHAMPADERVR